MVADIYSFPGSILMCILVFVINIRACGVRWAVCGVGCAAGGVRKPVTTDPILQINPTYEQETMVRISFRELRAKV